jgi:hypothetical protein
MGRLQQSGIIGTAPVDDRPRPDIDQIIQSFLPVLGDVALAAFGDDIARQLSDAVLPRLEAGGWKLIAAAQRIWAGERDGGLLTAGIDANSAAMVRQTLQLVEDGPQMIFIAQSIQLAQSRREADQLTAQALANGDAAQRADLARQLEETAAEAARQPEAPLQELAAHLRAQAARLREP